MQSFECAHWGGTGPVLNNTIPNSSNVVRIVEKIKIKRKIKRKIKPDQFV